MQVDVGGSAVEGVIVRIVHIRGTIEGGVERTLGSTTIGSTRRGTGGGSEHVAFQIRRPRSWPRRRTDSKLIDCSGDECSAGSCAMVPWLASLIHLAEIHLPGYDGRREVTRGGRIERNIRVVHVLYVHARGTAVVGGATLDRPY